MSEKRLGIHLATGPGLIKAAERAVEIGAAGLQLFTGNPTGWRRPVDPPATVEPFRTRYAELGLGPLSIHGAYLSNLASPDPEIHRKSLELLAWELTVAPAYGAFALNVHIGSHRGAGVEAGVDLYQLFQAQSDLLSGFGGHPLAAGLTLPGEHIELLAAALNRMVREQWGGDRAPQPLLSIDLTVTVADLGQALFRELKALEPCGMGNPVAKLLIRNAWFQRAFHKKLRDRQNKAVGFIKTEFELWDESSPAGFAGEWWGHYRDELPPSRCDVVVELDFNTAKHNPHNPGYHVKLLDVRPVLAQTPGLESPRSAPILTPPILDWRQVR